MHLASLSLQLNSILLHTRQVKQVLEMISKALVDECVNKGIDAGVEAHDDDAGDVGDVAVLLILVVVIKQVDNQHWEPRDSVHNAHL